LRNTSVGLGIERPFEQRLNEWVDIGINFWWFFARKTMFVKDARGFIVLPSGFGTLDELFEALTLVQRRKVTTVPVVLLGTSYWAGLIDWIGKTLEEEGMISPGDLYLIDITDSPAETVPDVQEPDQARHRHAHAGPSSQCLDSSAIGALGGDSVEVEPGSLERRPDIEASIAHRVSDRADGS
jgi:predicted Rossmann-fold nucleotide-binding protein